MFFNLKSKNWKKIISRWSLLYINENIENKNNKSKSIKKIFPNNHQLYEFKEEIKKLDTEITFKSLSIFSELIFIWLEFIELNCKSIIFF